MWTSGASATATAAHHHHHYHHKTIWLPPALKAFFAVVIVCLMSFSFVNGQAVIANHFYHCVHGIVAVLSVVFYVCYSSFSPFLMITMVQIKLSVSCYSAQGVTSIISCITTKFATPNHGPSVLSSFPRQPVVNMITVILATIISACKPSLFAQ